MRNENTVSHDRDTSGVDDGGFPTGTGSLRPIGTVSAELDAFSKKSA